MPSDKRYPFKNEEIQKIQKGIIYEQVVGEINEPVDGAVQRGGSVDSVSDSIDYLLKKLCSDNTYENPITNQRFEVRVVCDTESTHEKIQDNLAIAALVERLDAPEAIDQETTNIQASAEEEDYYLLEEEIVGANGDKAPTEEIAIHFRVLDTAGIEPPYRVRFLLMPNGTETENGDVVHPMERGQLPTFEPTGSITYTLPQCIEPSVHLTGLELASGSNIGAFLSWSDGSDPHKRAGKQPLAPVKLNRVRTLSGRNQVGDIDIFTLSVTVGGTVKYRVEGDYI